MHQTEPTAPANRTDDPAVADLTARATAWLRAWDSHDQHRTGTPGDQAGAAWLLEQARALGATPVTEDFPFHRLEPTAAYLELDGRRIEGVPVFDAPTTGPAGVTGHIGSAGSDAAIGLAELAPQAVYSGAYRKLRVDATHAGLVILTNGQHPGLALLNAEQFSAPYGAPALQVTSDAGAAVHAAMARGASVRLVTAGRRVPAQAANVVVRLPGRDAARNRLVVMTPRSSWWQSTAERGGGLVCWLESLRALLAAPRGCDVVLTANSGHELGHLGLDDFLVRRPGWDGPAANGGAVWVHYGANLGAAGGRLSLLSNDAALRTFGQATLTEAKQPPDVMAPATLLPSGETRDIHRAGGRYLTLVGSNPWFHMPQDRWPQAVDAGAVARIAAAGARLVTALAR